MKRDIDFEKRFRFDCNTDYEQVATEYGVYMQNGERDKALGILKKHGGIIDLTLKRDYQRKLLNG